jgi:hypothetical protein
LNLPSCTSITTIKIYFQNNWSKKNLEVDQKYPHLLSGKFCKWGYKYDDILEVAFNRKKKIYLLKPTYHIFYKKKIGFKNTKK